MLKEDFKIEIAIRQKHAPTKGKSAPGKITWVISEVFLLFKQIKIIIESLKSK